MKPIKINNNIKRNKYDIIITFGVLQNILYSVASIGLRTPVIVCERNDPKVYPLYYKIMRGLAYFFSTGAVFGTYSFFDFILYFFLEI